jgi:Zn-finger nucleic acid-binding protein
MNMNKFRITCPECGAELVTVWPQTLIWELCPGCRHHVWDGYDAMLAEVVTEKYVDSERVSATVRLNSN